MKRFTVIRFVVSVFTLIFITATILFFLSSSRKIFLSHSEFSLRQVAVEKSTVIETTLNYAESSIKLLSNFVSPQMTERELKNPNEMFSNYTEQLPFDFVEYIRWDGLNFMNSVDGSEPFDASDRVYYKEGIKGNTGIWTNYKPKVSKEALLNFYTPIYYNGEISGVITGAIGETSSLRQKLMASFFGYPIQSFVCDENYIVVSSACEEINPGLDLKRWTSINLLSGVVDYTNERDLKPFVYEYEGRKGLCCTSTIKSNGWHVVMIVYPSVMKSIQKEISGSIFIISILIIVILVVYLGVSLWIQAKAHRIIQEGLVISATRDELTGLLNRHAYATDLRTFLGKKIPDDFNYVLFDVNGLKNANDNYGHEAGDELIKAAANCIQECFGKYGKVYRTGGDEFIALINASDEEIVQIKNEFQKATSEWTGLFTSSLKIPVGIVSRKEQPESSMHEMSMIADQRMYKEKALTYLASGVDRRAQNEAYEVLCESYTKILKVNLATDEFSIIQMESDEKNESKGFSEKISEWIRNFGVSGLVHQDDVEMYLAKTSQDFLRNYFASGKKELCIQYRRKIGDEFHKVMMEMKAAKDYSQEKQNIFLYVKNIDKE